MTQHCGTSVIIPTHNRLDGLGLLLDDLSLQTRAPDEVVVVDSKVSVDSSDVVNAAAGRGLPVRRILSQNIIAAKRNAGAKISRGQLLVFLDDDMRVEPSFLESHSNSPAHDMGWASCGPVYFPDEWTAKSNYYRFKNGRHETSLSPEGFIPPHRFTSMNFSIRKGLFSDCGGFDEDYAMYGGEDLDFGYRVLRSGANIFLDTASTAQHFEVGMSWSRYFNKVHRAAYFGLPLLLAKNPEAAHIPTVQVVTDNPAHKPSLAMLQRLLRLGTNWWTVKRLVAWFERTDQCQFAYAPHAFLAVTLMVNRLGLNEQEGGMPYAAPFPEH